MQRRIVLLYILGVLLAGIGFSQTAWAESKQPEMMGDHGAMHTDPESKDVVAPPDQSHRVHNVKDHGAMDHSAKDNGAKAQAHKDHLSNDHDSNDQADGKEAGGHDHLKMVMAADKEDPGISQKVKVEERLGEYAALDAVFKDSTGRTIELKQIFDKPVVILPVYFMCTSVCNFLQSDLANALNFVNQTPGEEFNVVTVSFADDEDYTHAHTSKRNYTNLITRTFPLENWFYLTGDTENIRKLTDSLGYYFIKKKDHFYIHPSVLVVLAQDGKIARYLYGPSFLPFDLGMAISEAEKGEIGLSIKRGVMSFCFDYDPENKTYVFKVFRITGSAILILLTGFILFLVYPSKRDKRKKHTTVS